MVLEVLAAGAVALLLGKRSPAADVRPFDPDQLKIRCPLCAWQPQKHSRWYCDPGCHHHWNTFETAGVCPGCGKQWDSTACLKCEQWSNHEDWYVRGH